MPMASIKRMSVQVVGNISYMRKQTRPPFHPIRCWVFLKTVKISYGLPYKEVASAALCLPPTPLSVMTVSVCQATSFIGLKKMKRDCSGFQPIKGWCILTRRIPVLKCIQLLMGCWVTSLITSPAIRIRMDGFILAVLTVSSPLPPPPLLIMIFYPLFWLPILCSLIKRW